MRTKTMCLVVGLAGLLVCAAVSRAAEAAPKERNQSASVRVWYAEWEHPEFEFGGSVGDLGSEPMIFGYYDHGFGPWVAGVALGYGNRWEGDALHFGGDNAERTDVQLSVARSFGIWYAGAGYHWLETDAGTDISNMKFSYDGVELMLGVGTPLGDSRFSAHGALTYMPSLNVELSDTPKEGLGGIWDFDWEGDTTGYTVDVGVAYDWEQWHATLGYRLMKLDDMDVETGSLNETLPGDEFKGPYLEAGFSW